MSLYDKNMQKGRLKQHAKQKGVKQETVHRDSHDCRRGLGDVRKTTSMPEKKQRHGEKMAFVKPRESTYARASVQVAVKWRT